MRKNKLFSIAALAVSATALLTVGGCVAENQSESSSEEPTRELVWTVADFETWETGMQRIRIREHFGAMRENNDPAFVKSGKKSLEIHPIGERMTAGAPVFSFPLASDFLGYDSSDVSDAKEITFEFYNDEETPVNVAVGLTTSFIKKSWSGTTIEYQPLAPKQWTTVTYVVDHEILAISMDLKNMDGIFVVFENAGTFYEEEAPTVYLDDVVLTRYETAPENQGGIVLDEYEYLDFEKRWQQYIFEMNAKDSQPKVAIKSASDCKIGEAPEAGQEDTRETLTARSGEKVLHVELPIDEQGLVYTNALMASPKIFQASYLNGLPESEYGNVKFGFDIFYNDETLPASFGMYIHSDHTGIEGATKSLKQSIPIANYIKPYEWVRIEFTIRELYDIWYGAHKNNDFFVCPGYLRFTYKSFSDKPRDFYLDNMGFTVEEKDLTAAPEIILSQFDRKLVVGTELEMPTATFKDRYDLTGKVALSALYKDNGTWVPATMSGSKIVVDKEGEYKIVATAKNSLGNTTENEYLFEGIPATTEISPILAEYAAQGDENGFWVKNTTDDKKEWLTSKTDSKGQTREGVAKVFTASIAGNGAGFIGFSFSEMALNTAKEAKWDWIEIEMLIEADAADVTNVQLRSGSIVLGVFNTGEWHRIRITKEMLNATGKSWVNGTGAAMDDEAFYTAFNTVCGAEPSRLMYARQANGKTFNTTTFSTNAMTYYVNEVVWGCNEATES